MGGEEWRPIPRAPGYEASSLGRVRSVDRVVLTDNGQLRRYRGRLIGLECRNQYGHRKVPLQIDRRRVLAYVHDVVAEAFLGPKPPGLQVRHDSGVGDDNRPENLLYGTGDQNRADMERHGTVLRGERHPAAKLTNADVREIKRRLRGGDRHRLIAADAGVAEKTVASISCGKSWASVT